MIPPMRLADDFEAGAHSTICGTTTKARPFE